MIAQTNTVSAIAPQFWMVWYSLTAFMSADIFCSRFSRSFSMSSVNGRRSTWLNFHPWRVASEWCEMWSFHSKSINFSRCGWSERRSLSFSLSALPMNIAMHFLREYPSFSANKGTPIDLVLPNSSKLHRFSTEVFFRVAWHCEILCYFVT